MGFTRVQSRGQVTLPKEIREAAGINPGDRVLILTPTAGKIEIYPSPSMSLEEFFERFTSDKPYDDDAERQNWEAAAADEFARRMQNAE